MKPGVAFDVCHEVYTAAREIVGSRMPTLQMDRASKFLWRPDLKPRPVEYLADFAMAGSRALGEQDEQPFSRRLQAHLAAEEKRGAEASSDKAARALAAKWRTQRRRRELRASRLVLFRLYYLGGAEYHTARRLLSLSETSWSVWAEEIRTRVGRELLRSGMFPPSKYFREPSTGK